MLFVGNHFWKPICRRAKILYPGFHSLVSGTNKASKHNNKDKREQGLVVVLKYVYMNWIPPGVILWQRPSTLLFTGYVEQGEKLLDLLLQINDLVGVKMTTCHYSVLSCCYLVDHFVGLCASVKWISLVLDDYRMPLAPPPNRQKNDHCWLMWQAANQSFHSKQRPISDGKDLGCNHIIIWYNSAMGISTIMILYI